MAFDRFSQGDFEKFLGVRPDGKPVAKGGFYRIEVPNTLELVYARKVGPDLSLRIYSTIEGGFARTKDSDAIRIMIVWRPSEQEQALMLRDGVVDKGTQWPLVVGGDVKVLRVPTWRENLGERLSNYEEIMPPRCECGCPKVLRKPKKRKGQKWEPFWGCVLYKRCPQRTGVKRASIESTPPRQMERVTPPFEPTSSRKPPHPQATPVETTGPGLWEELPPWQPIPVEKRRPNSLIPYDEPPY